MHQESTFREIEALEAWIRSVGDHVGRVEMELRSLECQVRRYAAPSEEVADLQAQLEACERRVRNQDLTITACVSATTVLSEQVHAFMGSSNPPQPDTLPPLCQLFQRHSSNSVQLANSAQPLSFAEFSIQQVLEFANSAQPVPYAEFSVPQVPEPGATTNSLTMATTSSNRMIDVASNALYTSQQLNTLPSIGSLGHPHNCSACSFHWRKRGCRKGSNCEFCHYGHLGRNGRTYQ